MEIIDKINDENQINNKKDINQILPYYITSDIPLKPVLCIKAQKKDTAKILTKLKNKKLLLDKIYLKDVDINNPIFQKEYQRPNQKLKKNLENKYKEIEGNFFKRVKNYGPGENLIVVSFKDDLEYKNITKKNILEDYELKEDDLIENINIPCTESISDEQWKKNNAIWPQCNFISSKEKYIHNHSEEEKQEILDIYNKNILNNNDDNISCLLYDPKSKKILFKAKKDEKNIIGHDIMNLLDLYSESLLLNNNINKHENKEKEKDENDDNKFRKLGEKNPIGPKENEDLLNHIDNSNMENNNHQYYCEGLYVFTKEEPCLMCAMALVHNRISRLYFCETNEKEGALISKYSLDNYNLNHHYLIFQLK